MRFLIKTITLKLSPQKKFLFTLIWVTFSLWFRFFGLIIVIINGVMLGLLLLGFNDR